MIMNRHKLSHGTQEEIGHSLGLIVPESVKHYFNHVRTGEKPSSEYGTQVGKRRYSINKYFKENQIPLKEGYHYLTTLDESISFIKNNIALGNDIITCFNNQKLHNYGNYGHVSLIQSINNDILTLVNPEKDVPKLTNVHIKSLLSAITAHGKSNRAGFCLILPKR